MSYRDCNCDCHRSEEPERPAPTGDPLLMLGKRANLLAEHFQKLGLLPKETRWQRLKRKVRSVLERWHILKPRPDFTPCLLPIMRRVNYEELARGVIKVEPLPQKDGELMRYIRSEEEPDD